MTATAVRSNGSLELPNTRPQDEGLRIANLLDGRIDLSFQSTVLRFEVEQRNLDFVGHGKGLPDG